MPLVWLCVALSRNVMCESMLWVCLLIFFSRTILYRYNFFVNNGSFYIFTRYSNRSHFLWKTKLYTSCPSSHRPIQFPDYVWRHKNQTEINQNILIKIMYVWLPDREINTLSVSSKIADRCWGFYVTVFELSSKRIWYWLSDMI